MSTHKLQKIGLTRTAPVQGEGNDNDNCTEQAAMRPAMGVRRLFSFTQLYFFALSYMSSWEAMATNIGLVFYNGGPRAMVWGFFIVIAGVLCQVASLSEMASVQPIAGGQYHWTWHWAPRRYQRSITWLQGWVTWFSWISILAGVVNVAANVTTTLVAANYPSYVLQGWHTVLVMYAYLLVLGGLNMYAFWLIPWVEVLAGLLHIVLWIVVATVLLTLAPRHTAEFVFFEKSNLSGWNNDFVAFNLGIVLITWGFVGFDASAHLAEETRKARLSTPRAMFWSICMNGLLAFGMIVIFLTCLGDVDDVLTATYPLLAISLNATNSVAGASALLVGFLFTVISVSIGSVADGALPAYFSYVDPKQRIPVRSVWLPLIIVAVLALLNLASYTAFSVIISLSTFGLYQSYFLSIGCMLYARTRGHFHTAPWSLGKAGIPVNIFAMLYSAWLGIFMCFPNYLPITAGLMNYALPINAVIWIFAFGSWFAWGRKRWPGLDVEVIEYIVADGDRDTKE
ncbi:hypothetical protein M409DRAFT_17044 [Zasmidium cellare ATCC 36951]|uniref:Amino acid permease n=1 Tax=Zasmidium cellare ATCC 36951 TaxID=1080233 RepID=A0A6A6D605_ZASCE|nr:uncharacterized protein M409DRAFT_17044 [Zasmidium cellare ATCC 36951]KAF2173096.1 hypothetical protein M409DRAFT_17044 [Zasmidium cellare ATCC 36951]